MAKAWYVLRALVTAEMFLLGEDLGAPSDFEHQSAAASPAPGFGASWWSLDAHREQLKCGMEGSALVSFIL